MVVGGGEGETLMLVLMVVLMIWMMIYGRSC